MLCSDWRWVIKDKVQEAGYATFEINGEIFPLHTGNHPLLALAIT